MQLSNNDYERLLALPPESKAEAVQILEELRLRDRYKGKIFELFPEIGPLSRDKYVRHMEFFEAGARYRERCFMAGNRVGKTFSGGGYETALHLTGLYPDWWKGWRSERPVHALCGGDTGQTTRDIIQLDLLGELHDKGAGLIPRDCIGSHSSKAGVAGAVDTVRIKHVPTGEWSTCMFRSYDQGRKIFQGYSLDWIWFDEEPPMDVYGEALIRTATTGGRLALTFTPLSGMSGVVTSFLPKEYQLSA